MELSDGLLLQVGNGEQWCNRWKYPNEDVDRSTSPSVLRSVARTWKEGLLNRKRPFVGRCCHSCTPQSWEQLFNPSIPSLGLRNVIYINETHTRHDPSSPSGKQLGFVAKVKTWVWEEFGENMEKDFHTASRRFWSTIRRLRRGMQCSTNTVYSEGGVLLTLTRDVVCRWAEYFEELLNPTNTYSIEEAEPGGLGFGFSISGAEVAEVIKKLLGRRAPGVDEIRPEQRGWLARRLSYVLFVMERDVHKDMFTRNVVDNVLNSSRVEASILKVATDVDPVAAQPDREHKAVSKVKQKARAVLQEMVANVSPAFIRLTGWVLLRLFNGFFWSIQIHKGQLEMVKKAASEQKLPMVFLPVHKSHIDYLLITLILFCHNIKAPHIAAGNNLSIPILSTVIRKLGGFFIRRRMEDTRDGKKDILYRSLLHAYTEELLRQQQFLEVFLEGTRSRSGKPFPARAGMLSIVVDTVCTGAIGDLLVVPVGISYDRIIEGNYNSEQLGKPKKNESWWGIACGVFRMLRKNYGCVRVDFNQPFSLKEYLDTQRSRHIPPPVSLENALMPYIISTQPDGQFEEQEEEEMDREVPDELFRRHLINNLAKHVLYTANKSSAIMSTHIVACLLLYRHRQGVVLSKLVEDFFNMKEEILSRDFDLGFSGNSEDVVMRALHLMEKCINVTSSANRNGEFTIAPCQTVPALFELNFYSNGLFHVFIPDAIIACSILSLQRDLMTESAHQPKDRSSLLLSQERLIHKAAGLSQFLTNEVAVAPPCQTIYQVLDDAVTRLIQYGVLYVAEEDQEELNSSPTEEPWPKKFSEPLSWRSDEEDEDSDFGEEQRDRYLKVSLSTEHQEFFIFLQRLLSPVLEAYSGAAVFVHSLSQPVPECDYTLKLFRYLLTRTEREVAVYGESATHYLVKNTVKTFKELGVLKERRENRVVVLELSNTFRPQANRNKLLQYILSFTLL